MSNNRARLLTLLQLQALVLAAVGGDERQPAHQRTRGDFNSRAQLLLNEGQFVRCFKMSLRAFEELTLLLAPALTCDEYQSRRRTGCDPITPVIKLQVCLRWLGGGSYHDVRAVAGVSTTAFYDVAYETMHALIHHPDLQLRFPSSEEELRRSARSFQRLSNHELIKGCVGVVDGWLCSTIAPRKNEVKRVLSFFSGHYQCFGVNVQACCDHRSRFTAVSMTSGGGTGDALAYLRWRLYGVAEDFPLGLYLIGDNAYPNSNWLLTPFPRPQISSPYRDSYNYHVSQLRIRVEMAFGLLVRKWRMFRTPLEVSIRHLKLIVQSACVLHNWCINQRLVEDDDYDVEYDLDLVDGLVDAAPQANANRPQDTTVSPQDASIYRRLYESSDVIQDPVVDSELVRQALVATIQRNNYLRPQHNIERAQREQHE